MERTEVTVLATLLPGLVGAGLLAPPLPRSPCARDVSWRLLMVTFAGAAAATSPLALILAALALGWWTVSWITHASAAQDGDPTAAEVAAPVLGLTDAPSDPTIQRRCLDEIRFGVGDLVIGVLDRDQIRPTRADPAQHR